MPAHYLGLDIGTTGIKAVLFDENGRTCGTGLAEYTLETPAPDIVELDAEQYWRSTLDAISQALRQSGIAPRDIRAMGVTGQAETLIMVDASGKPLRKAIVWLDNRAGSEAKIIEKKFTASSLFHLSGQTEMLPCWPASKILWFRENEPQLFAKTAKYLMVEDYIIHKLTGRYTTCRGLMPSSLYYDIRTKQYDCAMLDFLGIRAEQLPALLDPGEQIGPCRENDSPIEPGTPVAAAPIDHVCGNLGSTCAEKGIISETTGCTLALCAAFPSLLYDEQRRYGRSGALPGELVMRLILPPDSETEVIR